MIKVDGIGFNNIRPNRGVREKKPLLQPSYTSLNPDYVMKSMPQMSLISFKGQSDYEKTLDENYFQLPVSKGAKPDVFQLAAASNLHLGNDVLVTAPTGTGKTAIAHYAITKNLKEGKKTFYTTPLKALSNEKYRDFQKTYGKENVGLLTGDVKQNVHAPIVIMTTEVYRNMVFGDHFDGNSTMLDNLKTVVFDELHYLGDVDRGGIWEQSIILSRPETQLLSLSATIGNNKDVSTWMANLKNQDMELVSGTNEELKNYKADEIASKHSVLVNVPPENRHVPLEFKNINVQIKSEGTNIRKTDVKPSENPLKQIERVMIDNESYKQVVEQLKKEDKLPGIFFIFSKNGSRNVLKYLGSKGAILNSKNEIREIDKIVKRYRREGKYLGESLNVAALMRGYAIHNSGLMPAQKELVEELFKKQLIKVVIATETLSAGINMPARSTVITSTRKPSSNPDGIDGKRDIAVNEFHQMAGRAGRRGMDKKGYCFTLSVDEKQKQKFEALKDSLPNDLVSSFKPDYSFVAHYYDNYNEDSVIKELFEKSFYAHDVDPKAAEQKSQDLFNIFEDKKNVLKNLEYIDDNELTDKGRLLAKLNGYEQIPVIEMIYNKGFKGMNPVELAAAVGTLANIQRVYNSGARNKEVEQVFEHSNENVKDYIAKTDKLLEECHKKISKYQPETLELKTNKNATKYIYEFANGNSVNNSGSAASRGSWHKLITGPLKDTIRDEGTVFKEMTATIDLLKQMMEITLVGKVHAGDNTEEFNYYKELKENIEAAIDLLSRSPVVEEDK